MRKSLWIVPIPMTGHWLLKAVLVLAAACAASPSLMADALPFTYTGDTTGAPTYTSVLGDTGHYVTFAFSVDTTGTYTFAETSSVFIDFALYQGSFDPANPITNLFLDVNDITAHTITFTVTPILAGATYILVDSGVALSDFGPFSTTITGPLGAQLTPLATPTPEPGTLSLTLLGVVGLVLVMRTRIARGFPQST